MRTATSNVSSPLLMNFNTPKKFDLHEEEKRHEFTYDPINQVAYYMDGGKESYSKKSVHHDVRRFDVIEDARDD